MSYTRHTLTMWAAGCLLALGCSNTNQQTARMSHSHDGHSHKHDGTHTHGKVSTSGKCCGACSSDAAKAKFEKDREAILAMAGQYKVTFDFKETEAIKYGYELKKPYHSVATELIEVIEDEGDRIVLQHILVLRGGKMVIKHWRQEWKYEDRVVFGFKGHRTWEPRTLDAQAVKGTWTQQVFQVDDSPRYEGVGKWMHKDGRSVWESETTWRPLPRREHSKRSDYHVMVAVNRHIITPEGWLHEQDNQKLVLAEAGNHVLAKETGLNVYTRLSDADLKAGKEYWNQTAAYWRDVRQAWDAIYEEGRTVKLREKVEALPMIRHMFAYAKPLTKGESYDENDGRTYIRKTLDNFRVVE